MRLLQTQHFDITVLLIVIICTAIISGISMAFHNEKRTSGKPTLILLIGTIIMWAILIIYIIGRN